MEPLSWLDREVLGNAVWMWSIGVALFLGVWVLLAFARSVVARRLRPYAERSNVPVLFVVARTVDRTQRSFPLLVALMVSYLSLAWTPLFAGLLALILAIGLLLQLGMWITAALDAYLVLRRRRQLVEDPAEVAVTDLLRLVLRTCVWIVLALVVLDTFGVNVSTLVAGLGIGGVAVALAAQSVLGDLFASLSIVLDRPFVVGDSLGIDDFRGRVERVGLKTTRLRSVSGEQVVFSNADLLDSRIRNFGRMVERRVSFPIGVKYGTGADDLRRIPAIVGSVVETEKDARFGGAYFSHYGDFALMFEVVYHVLSPAPSVHDELQHRINLALYERFAEYGIEFACPTGTLYAAGMRSALQPAENELSNRLAS